MIEKKWLNPLKIIQFDGILRNRNMNMAYEEFWKMAFVCGNFG